MALGAGNVQVCTAAMIYGFKIVEEMISGLSNWMDEKGHTTARRHRRPRRAQRHRLAVSSTSTTSPRRRIDQDLCIKCGRCHIACEDTSHQAITNGQGRQAHFEVIDDECVGCNLCVNVCPVEDCITMEPLEAGMLDERTGKPVVAGLRQLDDAPEQPDGEGRRGITVPTGEKSRAAQATPRHSSVG